MFLGRRSRPKTTLLVMSTLLIVKAALWLQINIGWSGLWGLSHFKAGVWYVCIEIIIFMVYGHCNTLCTKNYHFSTNCALSFTTIFVLSKRMLPMV